MAGLEQLKRRLQPICFDDDGNVVPPPAAEDSCDDCELLRETEMSHLRNRRAPAGEVEQPPPVQASYNIVPIQDVVMHGQHPSLRFPEVRAAMAALLHAADLPPPPLARGWDPRSADLFDWLGLTFGFQPHNARNQREHLVLLLANAQLGDALPRDHPPDVLHFSVAQAIRKKLLKN